MLTTRQKALNTVEYLKIAKPCQERLKHERTLHLEGVPTVWPSSVVAQYYLRVALENGCTRIKVYKGQHSRREYDVMDLVTMTRQLTPGGQLTTPNMKRVPANLATMRQQATGNRLEPRQGLIAVPSFTPVSSFKTGG